MTNATVRKMIRHGQILFGGNYGQKIYGHLKLTIRTKIEKRLASFFTSMDDVFLQGFRPCGNCMKATYKTCKDEFV